MTVIHLKLFPTTLSSQYKYYEWMLGLETLSWLHSQNKVVYTGIKKVNWRFRWLCRARFISRPGELQCRSGDFPRKPCSMQWLRDPGGFDLQSCLNDMQCPGHLSGGGERSRVSLSLWFGPNVTRSCNPLVRNSHSVELQRVCEIQGNAWIFGEW